MKNLLIILNYNGKKQLEYCLPSIVHCIKTTWDILLIDNASCDGSADIVEKKFPQITIIRNLKNYAWAQGNNIGIEYALRKGYEIIGLLNNDVLVPPGWLNSVENIFHKNSCAGILGFDIIGRHCRVPVENWRKAVKDHKEVLSESVEYVSGCCMLVRSNVFKTIGLFDRIYYKYGEEVDFQARAKRSGFQIVKSNIPIWHEVGATSRKMPISTAYYCIRNDLRFAIKQKSPIYLLKRVFKLAYNIMWPFRKKDTQDTFIIRILPSNYFVNNMIFLYAMLWNVLFLPQTLWIRWREYRAELATAIYVFLLTIC